MTEAKLDQLCVNTIRFLTVDAVEQANSGHAGAPMGLGPLAYVLWDRFLSHNPLDPEWPDRDRFVLSAGHASMLLYSLLHLTGYRLPLSELKQFRQLGSKTPGHPEYGETPGVETTTGPLGQGAANAVGMAIAERILAETYNRPDHEIIDHWTYCIVSDGDLMEGVASEAASLAGTLGLGKLIFLYDDNSISIEGDTSISFREDVGARFKAYGWDVIGPIDGMDIPEVDAAVRQARTEQSRPTLIVARTTIGFGSPNKAGKGSIHSDPLGADEARLTKQNLGWDYEDAFTIPEDVLLHMRRAKQEGPERQRQWDVKMQSYRRAYPEEAGRLAEALSGTPRTGWDQGLEELFKGAEKPVSTREASGKVINTLAEKVHFLVGGSADLAPSTKTIMSAVGHFSPEDHSGRNMHFGVREHGMGAIANGMARHGGVLPYTATFFIFSDYMRPAMRLAALMGQRVVFLFTHDSVGVGEDGPTHEPVEQLMGIRTVPNMVVIRPADANETIAAWKLAIERRDGPTVLALSRQNLPVLNGSASSVAEGVKRGAYVLWEAKGAPALILIGTGSEVSIALEAAKTLDARGTKVRVVSMPSWELFEAQSPEYREQVLPPDVTRRISVEAGVTLGWSRYVGPNGVSIGVDRFGASAPGKDVYQYLGLTPERVVEEAEHLAAS
jgi:transketolase